MLFVGVKAEREGVMVYVGIKANELETEELARLVQKAQALTRNSDQTVNDNYDLFASIHRRVLKLSKQESNWHLYFVTLYEMLFLNVSHHKNDEVVKYAEIFYKESDLHMDRELPKYPGTDMSFYNTWIYGLIFSAYYEYHQIDDAKMDAFLARYEESALKYGKTYKYYDDLMKLSILYRDADMAKDAAKNFRRYESDMKSCYVCGHREYLYHLLLLGENRQAEELMLKLIHKNIPKQHLWCYESCQTAAPEVMYWSVLYDGTRCGNEEMFHYIFEKYWKTLPHESQWKSNAFAFRRLLCAAVGFFDEWKDDIEEAEREIRGERQYTTVDNIEFALEWWCYFILLDRSGVHEVEISLSGLKVSDSETDAQAAKDEGSATGTKGVKSAEGTDGSGMVPTLTVASYMENVRTSSEHCSLRRGRDLITKG